MARDPHLVTADADRPLRAAAVFVAVTFLIAAGVYLPAIASDRGWIGVSVPSGLVLVGVLSPGIATVVIHLHDDGVAGVRRVFGWLTAWRFGRVWWGVAVALPPVFIAGYLAAYVGLGHDVALEPPGLGVETVGMVVLLALLTAVTAVGEEIGWRGHLLPLLQARMSAVSASLLLGGIWAVWHVPLFLGFEGLALPLRLLSIVFGAVMYTWLFNNTGGSVLAVALLHFGTNMWARLAGLAGAPPPTDTPAAAAFAAVNLLVAAVVLVGFGGATLTGRRSPPGG
jgi:membrane protease YdiL (CAAX protease family)